MGAAESSRNDIAKSQMITHGSIRSSTFKYTEGITPSTFMRNLQLHLDDASFGMQPPDREFIYKYVNFVVNGGLYEKVFSS